MAPEELVATSVGRCISDAIQIGAPTYNHGDHTGCYFMYRRTAEEMVKTLDDRSTADGKPLDARASRCRTILQAGLTKAASDGDNTESAWTMRHAFDEIDEDQLLRAVPLKAMPQMRHLKDTRAGGWPSHAQKGSKTAPNKKLIRQDEVVPIGELVQRFHDGVTCDRSGVYPVVGVRYRLRDENYDLCAAEWAKLPQEAKDNYESVLAESGWAPHGREGDVALERMRRSQRERRGAYLNCHMVEALASKGSFGAGGGARVRAAFETIDRQFFLPKDDLEELEASLYALLAICRMHVPRC